MGGYQLFIFNPRLSFNFNFIFNFKFKFNSDYRYFRGGVSPDRLPRGRSYGCGSPTLCLLQGTSYWVLENIEAMSADDGACLRRTGPWLGQKMALQHPLVLRCIRVHSTALPLVTKWLIHFLRTKPKKFCRGVIGLRDEKLYKRTVTVTMPVSPILPTELTVPSVLHTCISHIYAYLIAVSVENTIIYGAR